MTGRNLCKGMCEYDEVLSQGGSGMILKATVDGLPLAIKYWNRVEEQGREWFINEIDIIEYLLDTAPDLLGSVLPRVVAIQRDEPFDSVLVTEFVGEELEYADDEILLRGIPVRGEGENLYETGLDATQRLHAAGVTHRDICLRRIYAWREWWTRREKRVGECGFLI